jgi:hypothetical protein
MIPKMMRIGRRLAKLNPPSSRKAMIEVDFGVYWVTNLNQRPPNPPKPEDKDDCLAF